MNSSVIVFPGSNCDRDIKNALEKMQFKNKWSKETSLPKSDLIVIPGGFSYGDYLPLCDRWKIFNYKRSN